MCMGCRHGAATPKKHNVRDGGTICRRMGQKHTCIAFLRASIGCGGARPRRQYQCAEWWHGEANRSQNHGQLRRPGSPGEEHPVSSMESVATEQAAREGRAFSKVRWPAPTAHGPGYASSVPSGSHRSGSAGRGPPSRAGLSAWRGAPPSCTALAPGSGTWPGQRAGARDSSESQ